MSEESASHPPIAPGSPRREKRKRKRKWKPKAEMLDWRTFDPSTIETGGDNILISELITYKKNLDRLLERKGEYVLIKGDEIVGYYPTLANALDAGAERFGREPALIKKIVLRERIHSSSGLAD